MELSNNHQEESMNSGEETKQESTYIHVGRFYECVFCKRGFDTAQALGGHMNIHRRDRARNRPTTRSKKEENYTGPRFYQQIPISRNDHKYSTCFTGATSAVTLYENPQQQNCGMNDFDHDRRNRTNQPISPDDWRVRLDIPPVIMGGLEMNHDQEELDLELRLGYDY